MPKFVVFRTIEEEITVEADDEKAALAFASSHNWEADDTFITECDGMHAEELLEE